MAVALAHLGLLANLHFEQATRVRQARPLLAALAQGLAGRQLDAAWLLESPSPHVLAAQERVLVRSGCTGRFHRPLRGIGIS